MRLFIFILLLIGCNIVTLASEQPVIKHDTIENVIYEYDTVFVSTDTIRITDTIINYQTVQPEQIKEKTKHWSVGVSFLAMRSNFFGEKNAIDSFTIKNATNYNYNLNLQYSGNRFIIGLGGGITTLHDRITYRQIRNTLIVSDSLSVVSSCTSDNYFRYINFNLSIGREWGKRSIRYAFNASLATDILIDYKAVLPLFDQIDNKIHDTSVRKIGWAVMINPSVIYRLGNQLDLYVSPCYRYTLNKRNLYPFNNLQDMGIAIGLMLKL